MAAGAAQVDCLTGLTLGILGRPGEVQRPTSAEMDFGQAVEESPERDQQAHLDEPHAIWLARPSAV